MHCRHVPNSVSALVDLLTSSAMHSGGNLLVAGMGVRACF